MANKKISTTKTTQPKKSAALQVKQKHSSSCCQTPGENSSPVRSCCASSTHAAGKEKCSTVIVKYDVGFNNHLFLRGEGANLNWERGVPLKNVKRDEWVWETDKPFASCKFKVLINDTQYEVGENHQLQHGATLHYTPKF